MVCNSVLIIAILKNKNLRHRREIQIILALSFADFAEAFATFCGGLYRISVILLDLKNTKFRLIDCMLLPHSWLWRWSDFATSFMLLTLTIDRLFSVCLPLKYITWRSTYSCIVIGTPYLLSLLLSMLAWHRPLTVHAEISMLCMNVYISPTFYALSKYLTAAASVLSILLYIPVMYLVRIQRNRVERAIAHSQAMIQRQAQLRMTMTIAFSAFATIFLDAIPRALGVYGSFNGNESEEQCESVMQILFHLTKINSMVNLFLYYRRNPAIRASILIVLRMFRAGKSCFVLFFQLENL
ncbi:unnamed protein product [Thelazia callipaeda]|uniref:G_PROTEIN_RECEP_F1_2 domain-containing protein n=1 Tax=Thelazia callipaeda TaxID=103827 RepID=A0A0N5D123_THECL|nr:unnamed protein product [Thelazia callipaeda]